jgi:hypothetical protein
LSVIPTQIKAIKLEYPDTVQVEDCHRGGFPHITISSEKARIDLIQRIALQICRHGLPDCAINRQPRQYRDAVRTYITKLDLSDAEMDDVKSSAFWSTSKHSILLLRGLLATGVLTGAFETKRWRVNFGLDRNHESPTKLAVPYHAKDHPSRRSEFSHTDMALLLTCLGAYFEGLSEEELRASFVHLLSSDQASSEYSAWIRDTPEMHSSLGLINIDNQHLWASKIYPSLRYPKKMIDYHLASVVFPKQLRDYPSKLSASSWDLGEKRANLITGFSGTVDTKHVLPLSMTYLDLDSQRHTDALVAVNISHSTAGVLILPQALGVNKSKTDIILDALDSFKDEVRVIIDVGASILDNDSEQVSSAWLQRDSDTEHTKGVIYLNAQHEIMVLNRSGTSEPLHVSPLASDTASLLVYLNECHSRGTDLVLPEN